MWRAENQGHLLFPGLGWKGRNGFQANAGCCKCKCPKGTKLGVRGEHGRDGSKVWSERHLGFIPPVMAGQRLNKESAYRS